MVFQLDAAMTFNGDKMRRKRETVGLTQDELARLLGIQRQAILNYEKGKRKPTTDTLRGIVKELNTNSSYLMDEIEYDGPLTERESRLLVEIKRRLTDRKNLTVDDSSANTFLDNLPNDDELTTSRH